MSRSRRWISGRRKDAKDAEGTKDTKENLQDRSFVSMVPFVSLALRNP